MSFSNNSLILIRGQGRALDFLYVTDDTKSAVETAGYFNAAAEFLKKGSVIQIAGDLDGTPWHSSYVVSANDGTTVTLTEHASVTQNSLHMLQGESISSKASDAAVLRLVAPVAGTITKIWTVLNAALATGDATVTAAINGTPVTNGVVTATQSGSGAGDVDSATPTAANTVAAGDLITLTVGGSSTATATLTPSIEITPS